MTDKKQGLEQEMPAAINVKRGMTKEDVGSWSGFKGKTGSKQTKYIRADLVTCPEQPTPTPEGEDLDGLLEKLENAIFPLHDPLTDYNIQRVVVDDIRDEIKALFQRERDELIAHKKSLVLAESEQERLIQQVEELEQQCDTWEREVSSRKLEHERLEKELAEERGKHRWIPVSERLPEETVNYWVTTKSDLGFAVHKQFYSKELKAFTGEMGKHVIAFIDTVLEPYIPPGEQGEEGE